MVRGVARSLNRIGRRPRHGLFGLIWALFWLPAVAIAQQAATPSAKASASSASAATPTLEPVFTLPPPPFAIPGLPPISGDWVVSVGAGAEYKPDFEGARRYMLSPIPIFSIR